MLCIPCLKFVSGYNVEYNKATSFNPRMFRGYAPPHFFNCYFNSRNTIRKKFYVIITK